MKRWMAGIGSILLAIVCMLLPPAIAETDLSNPQCNVPATLQAGEPLEITDIVWMNDNDYRDQSYHFYLTDSTGAFVKSTNIWKSNLNNSSTVIVEDDGVDAGSYLLRVNIQAQEKTSGTWVYGDDREYTVTVNGSRPAAPTVTVMKDRQLESERNQVKISSSGLTEINIQSKEPGSTYWYDSNYTSSTTIGSGEAICNIKSSYSHYYENSRSKDYRFRVKVGGCWSEYSNVVTLTWTTLGKLATPTATMPETVRAGEPISVHIGNSNSEPMYYIRDAFNEETGTYSNSTSRNMIYAYSDSFDYTLHEYGLDAGKYRYRFYACQDNYEDSDAAECILTVTDERPQTPTVKLSANSIYEGEAITVTIQGNRKLEVVENLHAYPSRLYPAFNGRVIITTRDMSWYDYFSFRAKVDGCWTEEFRSERITVNEDESHSFSDIVLDMEGLTAYAGKDFVFPVELDPQTEYFTAGIIYCDMDETGYDHDAYEVAYEMVLKVSNGKATIPGEALSIPGTYRINFTAYDGNYGFWCNTEGYFLKVVDSSPSAASVTVTSEDTTNLKLYEELLVNITAPGASIAALKVLRMENDGSNEYDVYDFREGVKVANGETSVALTFSEPAIYYISAMAYVNDHWTEWSEPMILHLENLVEEEAEVGEVRIISCPDTVVAGEPFTIAWEPIEGADEYYIEYDYGRSFSGGITVPATQNSASMTIDPTEEQRLLLSMKLDSIDFGHLYVSTEANGLEYASNAYDFELIDRVSPTLAANKTQAGRGEEITFTVSGFRANDLRIRINGENKGLMSFETVNNKGTINLSFPSEGDYSIQVAVRFRMHSYSCSIWSGWSAPVTVHVVGQGNAPTIKLPADTRVIETEAFLGTDSVYIVINDGCTIIEDRAFANCPNLLAVSIPSSVTTINGNPFAGCGDDLVIITPSGSAADRFANQNGISTARE